MSDHSRAAALGNLPGSMLECSELLFQWRVQRAQRVVPSA